MIICDRDVGIVAALGLLTTSDATVATTTLEHLEMCKILMNRGGTRLSDRVLGVFTEKELAEVWSVVAAPSPPLLLVVEDRAANPVAAEIAISFGLDDSSSLLIALAYRYRATLLLARQEPDEWALATRRYGVSVTMLQPAAQARPHPDPRSSLPDRRVPHFLLSDLNDAGNR